MSRRTWKVRTGQPCPQEGLLGCVNAWRKASDSSEHMQSPRGQS